MGTKATELVDGCFAHAADDEPLFVLRANDELAPKLVDEWAASYYRKHSMAESWNAKRVAKYEEALQTANKMRAWKMMR